jgi:hypothetical protein
MNQINIPSITIDTPIPYELNLRAEGQPLYGLRLGKYVWSRLTMIRVWENHARWHGGVGEVINYTVRTVGLAPQTKRDKTFHVTERAAMVKYVNEWIAKTVERGLKEMVAQKSEKEMRANMKRAGVAHLIEKAGGVEARREAILREGDAMAAKEVLQYLDQTTYHAIFKAIVNNEPIVLDETTRTNILARHTSAFNGWSVKRHIEERMQELDQYLNEIKAEEAA